MARVEGWQEIGAREQGRAPALSGRARQGRAGLSDSSLLNRAQLIIRGEGLPIGADRVIAPAIIPRYSLTLNTIPRKSSRVKN